MAQRSILFNFILRKQLSTFTRNKKISSILILMTIAGTNLRSHHLNFGRW